MAANVTHNANGTLNIAFNGVQSLFIPTNGITGYNRNNNTGYGNITILQNHDALCNSTLCDLTLAHFDYIPSLGGNAFYAGVFGIYILLNLFFGTRYRTWGYMAAMFFGLSGEVVGYTGRLLLYQNPFDPTGNDFLIYLVSLTISPAFLSAAIYLCLARIVVVYGEHLSRFKPRTYTLIFCGCDIFSLVLQAAGGGIASGAMTPSQDQLGINVMLAGLSVQVASLFLFACMCAEFANHLRRNPNSWNTQHTQLYNGKVFKSFLIGLCVATLTIFIRSAFRVAELSGGFHGPLANNQVSFMVLEGAMVVTAASCLTLLHPGLCFQGFWHAANFSFLQKVEVESEVEMA
ncbi:putative RTA1 domain protein [Acephala macrosclerotiorum]|nr:putative RTA1 domain protein [Acephala macrosclerotiorum]